MKSRSTVFQRQLLSSYILLPRGTISFPPVPSTSKICSVVLPATIFLDNKLKELKSYMEIKSYT